MSSVVVGDIFARGESDTSAPPRVVTILIQGVPIAVPCPAWCTVDHASENLAFLEDLHHAGPSISLPVTQHDGSVEHVLVAQVCQWPFEGEHGHKGAAYVSMDADGSGECNGYAPAGITALTDQLAAYIQDLQGLARGLQGAGS